MGYPLKSKQLPIDVERGCTNLIQKENVEIIDQFLKETFKDQFIPAKVLKAWNDLKEGIEL